MSSDAAAPTPSFPFKSSRQPMLWAALAYASGILGGVYAWRPALWWVVAVVSFLLAAAYFARRRPGFAWALGLLSFLLVGALHIQLTSASGKVDTRIQQYAGVSDLQIVAHVVKDGHIREEPVETRQTLDLQAEQIQLPDQEMVPIHGGIRLNIYKPRLESLASSTMESPTISTYRYGDRLRFAAKLRIPHNFRNPGAFDYRGYLADHGIAAVASAKAENVELLPGRAGNLVGRWRSYLHRAIVAKVHELWTPREAALVDAMVIGEEAFIDRDTRIDFQRSGTYHVLVVSGMNVTILAFVVFWTLRRLHIGELAATLLTVCLCVSYAFITDVGAPVWRATLMCSVYLGTRLLYRDRAMLNAIGAAALAVLVFDPRQLLGASFQMTFVCVLIVAGIAIPILQRTSQLYKRALANWDSIDYAALLPPRVAQFRVDLQMISVRLARFGGKKWSSVLIRTTVSGVLAAWELVFVSAVMQMGLALPMAYYFHRATTIGLPANLVVVPLMQLLMPAAVAAVSLGFASSWAARGPALFTSLALHGILGTIRHLGILRSADLRVAMPSSLMIILAATALVLAMLAARRRAPLAISGIAAILIAASCLAFLPPAPRIHPGILEVTSIDVGEGDSILLVTPQGRTTLVDAGGPIGPGGSQLDFGEDVVSPYLWTRGITHLDAVAITHGHSDHIGGMIAVLKNFHPQELWVGLLPPSTALENIVSTAQSLQVKVVRHWQGDEFEFGGANVRVLFPPPDWPVSDRPQNNDSLVMRVSYANTSVLLEGDAEKKVERRLAASELLQANLLKVGHHGSANSTTSELMAAVRPQFAIMSVGLGNPFGLPKLETLGRLRDFGTRVYRTDLDGAVSFYLDGKNTTPSVADLP